MRNHYLTAAITSRISSTTASNCATTDPKSVFRSISHKFIVITADLDVPQSHHYQLLLWLGFKPSKIYQTVFESMENFCMIFRSENSISRLPLYPMTFDGIKLAIENDLPLAYHRLQPWLPIIKEETESNLDQFLSNDDFYEITYDAFISLPHPVTKIQAFNFLISEMYIHQLQDSNGKELYYGDGSKRYLCSVKEFIKVDTLETVPMSIIVPEEIIKVYSNPSRVVSDFLHKSNGKVFGRICSTPSRCQNPQNLSYIPGRETAFVFGPETVRTLLLQKKPYEILLELGMLPEGIHDKCCVRKHVYWLILLCQDLCGSELNIYEATWQGIVTATKDMYPEAYNDLLVHLKEIKATRIEVFERIAQFRFIDVLPFRDSPNYFSYERFCNLPQPRMAWQVRLFLYCEFRVLELFTGDGYTKLEDGKIGEKEYLCRNYNLSQLDENQYVTIPLSVDVPDEVIKQFGKLTDD